MRKYLRYEIMNLLLLYCTLQGPCIPHTYYGSRSFCLSLSFISLVFLSLSSTSLVMPTWHLAPFFFQFTILLVIFLFNLFFSPVARHEFLVFTLLFFSWLVTLWCTVIPYHKLIAIKIFFSARSKARLEFFTFRTNY